MMDVKNKELIIVRGINANWFNKNYSNFYIAFGGNPQAVPKNDAYYVGLYLNAPISAITHLGIVENIHRFDGNAEFYLKAIIKLKKAIKPKHAIRKHENWSLEKLGIDASQIEKLVKQLDTVFLER